MNDLSNISAMRPGRGAKQAWPLTVVDAFYVGPTRRRVRLVSDVDGFTYRPGQNLLLMLPDGALRRFCVRAFDPVEERLDVDFVLRGDTPTTQWARAAKHGDQVTAQGARPRA